MFRVQRKDETAKQVIEHPRQCPKLLRKPPQICVYWGAEVFREYDPQAHHESRLTGYPTTDRIHVTNQTVEDSVWSNKPPAAIS